jgi:hypothetical protein
MLLGPFSRHTRILGPVAAALGIFVLSGANAHAAITPRMRATRRR